MSTAGGIAAIRPQLARDGVFNARDLGGIVAGDGAVIAPGRVIRADALQRSNSTLPLLEGLGITRVLDLRDEREREAAGVLRSERIEVVHLPVLDPTFTWHDDDHPEPTTLLAHRYRVILESFSARFVAALEAIAATLDGGTGQGSNVAYHCAVGKDRTGLLTALLLGAMGSPHEAIVTDYARSAGAMPVQVNWLWSLGRPQGDTSDEELATGVWSARPETMTSTLRWLDDEHGGAREFLTGNGLTPDVLAVLEAELLVRPGDRIGSDR